MKKEIEKVEIKGRLLDETHKNVLEAILSAPKAINPKDPYFKVRTTASSLLQKMCKDASDKAWLLKQIDHISQSRIKVYYNDGDTFDFGIITAIRTIDGEEEELIEITTSREYTHLLLSNMEDANTIEDPHLDWRSVSTAVSAIVPTRL